MTTTDTRPCSFHGCNEPAHTDGICIDHYRQFRPDTPVTGPQDAAPTAPAATAAPRGRLRLSPMFTLVGMYEGLATACYGVYGTGELAESAAEMLTALGIPGRLQILPFYEVTP